MNYVNEHGEQLTYDELDKIEQVNEIRHNLWQGNCGTPYDGFDMVVSCESWERRRKTNDYRGLFIHLPFADADDEEQVPWGSIETVAEAIAHALTDGAKVLVHCTAGLNRSSLVVHQALRAIGLGPQEAVDRIREKRSKWCLCNKTFLHLCLEN